MNAELQEQDYTPDRAQLLAEVLHLAREATIIAYAMRNHLPYDADNIVARRVEFYRLGPDDQRLYRVRPNQATVAAARSEESVSGLAVKLARAAVAVYRESGDAGHAMASIGIPLNTPWVEQKRNSQGICEVLASDLFNRDPEGEVTAMEMVESQARDAGLYDTIPAQRPTPPEEEAETQNSVDRLLAIARERIPQRQFAVFLAVVVDGTPHRKVARELNLSYRQVWQMVEFVRDSLRRIAAES